MSKEIRRFIFKCLLFTPIMTIWVAFPTWVAWKSGELLSSKDLVRLQNTDKMPVLVGTAYSSFRYSKILAVTDRKPKVIILGSSRTGMFRSAFFKSFDEFYNAGTVALLIEHFYEFLKRVPIGSEPEILIMGIDQRTFHPELKRRAMDLRRFDLYFKSPSPMEVWGRSIQKVLIDYLQKKYTLHQLMTNNDAMKKIGLLAITENSGLLNDGSWYYGNSANERPGYDKMILNDIKTVGEELPHGNVISEKSVQELQKFLDYCHSRNIYVIGYLNPFPHSLITTMKSLGTYQYMFDLPQRIAPLFASLQYPFYDFSDLESLGASDEETIDIQHPSEKAAARLLIKIAEHDERLRKYVSVDTLKKRIRDSNNPKLLFSINEF